jgi:cell shape-determining protein MreC
MTEFLIIIIVIIIIIIIITSSFSPRRLPQAVNEGLDFIEAAVSEYERQTSLLQLQGQFMGYIDLYAPNRRLLKEVRLLMPLWE